MILPRMFRLNFLPSVFVILGFFTASSLAAQVIEGYAYESGNRGYLNVVQVDLVNTATQVIEQSTFTGTDGFFMFDLPPTGNYELRAIKDMFENKTMSLDRSAASNGKLFIKLELKREPGYLFEITMAPKRENEDVVVDAIQGALIEVYNNTTKKEELVLKDHPNPEFRLPLEKGNHYTILIRKEGFLAKRMEAYVNVKGCILCFDGLGDVKPGVTDNLSEGNQMGVLLANVELEPSFEGKKMEIQNIYYDLGKASLRPESKEELQKVITLMRDNPGIAVEIGSHTDSRGKFDFNLDLSQRRAESVVKYLLQKGDIAFNRLVSAGYGETQLTNKCQDGVECTEKEHQANRRTELTIIGKVEGELFKSLAQMKADEEMEALIQSLQNQEQVRVPEGAVLDTASGQWIIKEELPADPASKTDESNDSENGGQQNKQTEVSMEFESMESLEMEQNRRTRRIEAQQKPEVVLDNNDPNSLPMSEAIKRHQENKKHMDNYTGFKLVVHKSEGPLPSNHPVFENNNHVYFYKDGLRFLYMVGDFPSKEAAEKAFEEEVSEFYPQAFIVAFAGGMMID